MIHLSEYINNAVLMEGGHSIGDAGPIRGDIAKKIAINIMSAINKEFNIECRPLGSTIKKNSNQTTGDIDIAIEYDWEKYDDILTFLKDKYDCSVGNINKSLHVFNIGYAYNDGEFDKVAQVDFMFTDDVEFAEFAYNSPDFNKNESKYKGMYQSILLMSIVSNTPITDALGKEYAPEYFTENDYDGTYENELKNFWKMYFDQNDGLKVEQKTFVGKTKPTKNHSTVKGSKRIITKDINKILDMCLGPKATKETCKSFENEFEFIFSDDYIYKSKERLTNIMNDFLDDWQFKMKTSDELKYEFKKLFEEKIKETF